MEKILHKTKENNKEMNYDKQKMGTKIIQHKKLKGKLKKNEQ